VTEVRHDRRPLLVDVELHDGGGLDVVENLAGAVDAELVQQRRDGGGVDDRLRGTFQDGLAHDRFLRRRSPTTGPRLGRGRIEDCPTMDRMASGCVTRPGRRAGPVTVRWSFVPSVHVSSYRLST